VKTTDVNPFETANAGFAQALYEDYLRDPASVSPEWRALFDAGVVGEKPPVATSSQLPASSTTGPASQNGGGTAERVEVKGPAARLAANMEESLGVPTATTFRQLPVTVLDSERAGLNAALASRDIKLSYTHLIAYALVLAWKKYPVMGHSYRATDGTAFRHTPTHLGLGLAVDIERKDGSRGLVVPVIKDADTMDFAAFHAAYETLVEKARGNKLMPDDFSGGSVTLTNPGGLGTSMSVARLMAGQGSIIATGAIAYPPEFSGVSKERLKELGIAKVMTVSSTYDHRVIQGAESGEFLREVDLLLQGGDGFYAAISASLQVAEGRKGGTADTAATQPSAPPIRPSALPPANLANVAAAMFLVDNFRTHGHLGAHLDPLGSAPRGDPALDPATVGLTDEAMAAVPADVLRVHVPGNTLAEVLPHLRATYCGTLAYEIEHVSSHEQRAWLRDTIESGKHRVKLDAETKKALLKRLTEVEALERFLHKAYLGQKRFSIEGVDLMVPMLDVAIEMAAAQGVRDIFLGMAHRGRLNVIAHTVRRPYVTIFSEFEGIHKDETAEEFGTGDVKYHIGAEGMYPTAGGKAVTVSLAHNPSHLEFVGPVVTGRARAKQTNRRGQQALQDTTCAMPIVIHGDAAFAGQGVVAETLNLGFLKGYTVGGTIHLITNNQVGFTTEPSDARSTTYASDQAKGFDIPVIHVNADDAEGCLDAIRLAMMYRAQFREDVVIDLVGYRRHGHNEGDEPAYTQPQMYATIKDHPTARALYAGALEAQGVMTVAEADTQYEAVYQHLTSEQQGLKAALAHTGQHEVPARKVVSGQEPLTAVPADTLTALNEALVTWPEGFSVHPKLLKQLERRRQVMGPEGGIEWAQAEALAFASLLAEGVPIRLTGQDTERGTFSQRHLVLHDVKNGATWAPIQKLPSAQAPFEVFNSPLSELATVGFEYGYSASAPEALVLWEAQFGDFVNGAQVIIDQFLTAGLSKWGVATRLVMLLPHGFEGQGPEHSSARLERFLQLAAENNIRVANCTTPANYFHLLRRQALRTRMRPLIVMTPKSLLRHPLAQSSLADMATGKFQKVLDDSWASERADSIRKLVLCSGKIYYDLLPEAEKLGDGRPAIARIEQLYTFPEEELKALFAKYPNLTEVTWAQEEPRNMGAWDYLDEKLLAILGDNVTLRYAGRPERASPAEGYPAAHQAEQARLVAEALGK
jgi:2-oxoglutarate dehydrogenase E1 component